MYFRSKSNVVIKQHIINNFKSESLWRIDYDFADKQFVQWLLYGGNKKPERSFKWLLVMLYRWLLYREKFGLKT